MIAILITKETKCDWNLEYRLLVIYDFLANHEKENFRWLQLLLVLLLVPFFIKIRVIFGPFCDNHCNPIWSTPWKYCKYLKNLAKLVHSYLRDKKNIWLHWYLICGPDMIKIFTAYEYNHDYNKNLRACFVPGAVP